MHEVSLASGHRTFRLGTRVVAVAWMVAAIAISTHARALDPKTSDPRVIMRTALEAQFAARSASRLKMSIKDRSGARERLLSVWTKRFEDARKTLILIEQPADVRNTGFLSFDYRTGGRADEQWLYTPTLHRVTRVPTSGKAQAFVGSDFSIFDLSQQDPDGYAVTLLDANARVGDETCWLIESKPRNPAVRDESGYDTTQFWVSKTKLVVLQLKATLVGGQRVKYFKASDVRNENGGWTARRMHMRTIEGTNVVSETTLDVLATDYSAEAVSDDNFTRQRLERGM